MGAPFTQPILRCSFSTREIAAKVTGDDGIALANLSLSALEEIQHTEAVFATRNCHQYGIPICHHPMFAVGLVDRLEKIMSQFVRPGLIHYSLNVIHSKDDTIAGKTRQSA